MKQAILGGCHCGAVRFSCNLDLSAPTSRCNCSVCSKARYWFAPVSSADFTLLVGEAALADYRFGAHAIQHRFCRTCGIKAFGETSDPAFGGPFFVAIGCLELAPEALARLKIEYHDGAANSSKPPAITSYL